MNQINTPKKQSPYIKAYTTNKQSIENYSQVINSSYNSSVIKAFTTEEKTELKNTLFNGSNTSLHKENCDNFLITPIAKKIISFDKVEDSAKSTFLETYEKLSKEEYDFMHIRKVLGIEEKQVQGKSSLIIHQEFFEYNLRCLKYSSSIKSENNKYSSSKKSSNKKKNNSDIKFPYVFNTKVNETLDLMEEKKTKVNLFADFSKSCNNSDAKTYVSDEDLENSMEKQSKNVSEFKDLNTKNDFYLDKLNLSPSIKDITQYSINNLTNTINTTPFNEQITIIDTKANSSTIKVTYSTILSITKQILQTLVFLNSKNINHGNLTPENILLTKELTVKLSDVQTNKNNFSQVFENQESALDYPEDFFENEISHCYKAPELILGSHEVDIKNDMWSLGVVLLELITGKNPFKAESNILSLFKIFQVFGTPNNNFNKELTELPYFSCVFPPFEVTSKKLALEKLFIESNVFFDAQFIELLSKMLEMNKEYRITPEEALNYSLFNSNF